MYGPRSMSNLQILTTGTFSRRVTLSGVANTRNVHGASGSGIKLLRVTFSFCLQGSLTPSGCNVDFALKAHADMVSQPNAYYADGS